MSMLVGVIKVFLFIRCSNRAAAFLSLVKLSKALADAETTIKLNPQWEKVKSKHDNVFFFFSVSYQHLYVNNVFSDLSSSGVLQERLCA